MDEPVQPRSLKLTIKMKSCKSVDHSGAANPPNNVAGASAAPASAANNVAGDVKSSATPAPAPALNNVAGDVNPSAAPVPAPAPAPAPCSPRNSSQDQVKISSPETIGNNKTENDENQAPDKSQYQLVLYDPAANGGQNKTDPEPSGCQNPLFSGIIPCLNQTPRFFPSVGAYTVQCAECFKWRLIPTQEKYEEIREHIIDQPFVCETAREWRSTISCEDPPDIVQDGSRLWAIDKPSIAKPPSGWQRILRIRAEGGSKFADVYYVSPSKKRLRSMIEVDRHLNELPEMYAGISRTQFSFQIPKPLQENYVKKRPARAVTDDANNHALLLPTQAEPLAWASPNVDTDLHLTGMELLKPEGQSAKRKRPSSSKKEHSGSGDISYEQNVVNLEDDD